MDCHDWQAYFAQMFAKKTNFVSIGGGVCKANNQPIVSKRRK